MPELSTKSIGSGAVLSISEKISCFIGRLVRFRCAGYWAFDLAAEKTKGVQFLSYFCSD
jgi:hypothetical protein